MAARELPEEALPMEHGRGRNPSLYFLFLPTSICGEFELKQQLLNDRIRSSISLSPPPPPPPSLPPSSPSLSLPYLLSLTYMYTHFLLPPSLLNISLPHRRPHYYMNPITTIAHKTLALCGAELVPWINP